MKSRNQPHTATYRNHKVAVTLSNGEKFVDRFLDRKGHYVIFKEHKVRRGDIRKFVPYHAEAFGANKQTETDMQEAQRIDMTLAKGEGKTFRCTAQVICKRCRAPFSFTFSTVEAGIERLYKAEEIASAYVQRCAPLNCSKCI